MQVNNSSGTPQDSKPATAYHTDTRLPDGRPSLLIDPGSKGNISGSEWMINTTSQVQKNGLQPSQERRSRPLTIRGVGHGNQVCNYNCTQPVALKTLDGKYIAGNYTAPTVDHSELPALLGNQTLTEHRAIIDFGRNQLHMIGQGDVEIVLPPTATSFQLEISPSGHLVLPCGYYTELQKQPKDLDESQLTLVTNTGPPARETPSSSNSQAAAP